MSLYVLCTYVPTPNLGVKDFLSLSEVLFPMSFGDSSFFLFYMAVHGMLFCLVTLNRVPAPMDKSLPAFHPRGMCTDSTPVLGNVFWGFEGRVFWELIRSSFSWTRFGFAVAMGVLGWYTFPISFFSYAWGFDLFTCMVSLVALNLKVHTGLGWRDFFTPLSRLPVDKAHALGFCLFSALLGGTAGVVTNINPCELVPFLHVMCFAFAHFAVLSILRGLMFNVFFGVKVARPDLFLGLVVFWLIPSMVFWLVNKYFFRHFADVGLSMVVGAGGRSGFVQGLRYCRENGIFDAFLIMGGAVTLGMSITEFYQRQFGAPQQSTPSDVGTPGTKPTPTSGSPSVLSVPRTGNTGIHGVFSTRGNPGKSFFYELSR